MKCGQTVWAKVVVQTHRKYGDDDRGERWDMRVARVINDDGTDLVCLLVEWTGVVETLFIPRRDVYVTKASAAHAYQRWVAAGRNCLAGADDLKV